jgi:hypothetical protein
MSGKEDKTTAPGNDFFVTFCIKAKSNFFKK